MYGCPFMDNRCLDSGCRFMEDNHRNCIEQIKVGTRTYFENSHIEATERRKNKNQWRRRQEPDQWAKNSTTSNVCGEALRKASKMDKGCHRSGRCWISGRAPWRLFFRHGDRRAAVGASGGGVRLQM
ncbi:hypothetical protein PR202_gb29114 [Eleusine coracana subsp. coracana]|uniref:Uncharacterized protein n=1 Tax=Eleusine coracana subsp. coracana TaxID=191504 RepID=A0AAV5FW91_ELECO|nr:hypothetical protein PR202_gb29114 [Eleusine coracana subsp. coracana]